MALNKLHDCAIDIAKETAVDALETCGADNNKAFIKATLRSTLNGFLVSTLNDLSGIRKPF